MRKSTQRRSRLHGHGSGPESECRGSRRPLPAWDRRTWLVAIPLALIVIYAFIPALDNGFVVVGRRSELPRQPLFPWSGRSPGEVGLDYVLGRRLPAAGVVALRGAICLLRTRPTRLPPDQPAPPGCQRRGPVCLDGGLARPMPDRFLPRESVDVLLERGAGDRPVRGAPAAR